MTTLGEITDMKNGWQVKGIFEQKEREFNVFFCWTKVLLEKVIGTRAIGRAAPIYSLRKWQRVSIG